MAGDYDDDDHKENRWLERLLHDKKNKKYLLYGIIFLSFLFSMIALIVASSAANQKNNEKQLNCADVDLQRHLALFLHRNEKPNANVIEREAFGNIVYQNGRINYDINLFFTIKNKTNGSNNNENVFPSDMIRIVGTLKLTNDKNINHLSTFLCQDRIKQNEYALCVQEH